MQNATDYTYCPCQYPKQHHWHRQEFEGLHFLVFTLGTFPTMTYSVNHAYTPVHVCIVYAENAVLHMTTCAWVQFQIYKNLNVYTCRLCISWGVHQQTSESAAMDWEALKQYVANTNEYQDYNMRRGMSWGHSSCTEIQSETAYAYIGKITWWQVLKFKLVIRCNANCKGQVWWVVI